MFKRHYWLRLARLKLTLGFCRCWNVSFAQAEIEDVNVELPRLCKAHASVDNMGP